MEKQILTGVLAAVLGAPVLTGCNQEENLTTVNTANDPAPLSITVVEKERKGSRVAMDDNNGQYMSADGLLAVRQLTWEKGDTIYAYSPYWVNNKGNTGSGYTPLVIDQYDEYTNSATFTARKLSSYAAGKPLFVYYHGGDMTLPGKASQEAVITRLTRDAKADHTLFAMGAGAKSLKKNPFYLASGYIAEAPADGKLTCSLEGRTAFLCLLLPFGQNLPADVAKALDGKIKYEITVAAKKNNEMGFPIRYSMKFDNENMTLSQDWERDDSKKYGAPLSYTITNVGLTADRNAESLLAGNGRVYLTLPAISYTNLRMEVKMTVTGADSGLLATYFPGLDVANGVTFTWPSDTKKGLSLSFDPNNKDNLKANMVYTAGKTGEVMTFSDGDIYKAPGNGWTIIDGSIINAAN